MRYKLIIRPEAEAELLQAVKWYEEKIKGLGTNFLLNIEATIESILRIPEAYTPTYKNTRRALVRKFPFGVHYIVEKEDIVILAIFHARRNPKEWKKRIP
jgi:toxin ParE1/3/4